MYRASFILTFVLTGAVAFALLLPMKRVWTMSEGCRSTSIPATFLAYCQNPSFASYEHAAVFYGLEPAMVENLRRADVVFVGDSELLIGFSEANVEEFFARRGIRYFLLGFGYGESSEFASAVLKKYAIKPKVMVLNIDPFFRHFRSAPALDVLGGGIESHARGIEKKLSQELHNWTCQNFPARCAGTFASIYRSPLTGRWYWHDTLAPPTLAYPFQSSPPPDPKLVADAISIGETFLAEVGLDRQCLILTGVPTPEYDTAFFADTLAARLGTRSVNVSAEGLATIDRGHLNAASAERWSAAFLTKAEPVVRGCLDRR
jgi:hypothetical protein